MRAATSKDGNNLLVVTARRRPDSYDASTNIQLHGLSLYVGTGAISWPEQISSLSVAIYLPAYPRDQVLPYNKHGEASDDCGDRGNALTSEAKAPCSENQKTGSLGSSGPNSYLQISYTLRVTRSWFAAANESDW